MVLYFVELGKDVTSTELHGMVMNNGGIEYQGILTSYTTVRGNKLALFIVDDASMLEFKILFPISSMVIPKGVPDDVYRYFINK
jgi:hypothetical protein